MTNHNNSRYRCIILDDDPEFVYLLSQYISLLPKLQICATYNNPNLAMDSISEEDSIDFLFLDIRMGNTSGMDVARHLRQRVKFIVFISATGEYALDALQLGGDHYLVKPIEFSRFFDVVNGILKRYRHPVMALKEILVLDN